MLAASRSRMRATRGLYAACVGLLWSATFALAGGTPEGQYAVTLVDQAHYQYIHSNTVSNPLYTHNGHNKGWGGAQHDPCRNSILNEFQASGWNANLHQFTFWLFFSGQNVIAEKLGTTQPSKIYILGAHYDSADNPGADDDASGVAALLEIAGIIADWDSACTIRLCAFDKEELGLLGSAAYADDVADQDITGMIALDMIAYRDGSGNTARIYGRTTSNPVKLPLAQALSDYAGITATIGGQLDASDHASFEAIGKPACCLIEYNYEGNPHYHTSTDSCDTPNYLDYSYAVQLTKGTLGWLVDAAGIQPPHPVGDLNCDYLVDFGDINPFVLALTSPAAYATTYPDCDILNGDINGDGAVDFGDINPFIALLTR
jgi:Zn-dependent M28 family amino/carboxypeptidase